MLCPSGWRFDHQQFRIQVYADRQSALHAPRPTPGRPIPTRSQCEHTRRNNTEPSMPSRLLTDCPVAALPAADSLRLFPADRRDIVSVQLRSDTGSAVLSYSLARNTKASVTTYSGLLYGKDPASISDTCAPRDRSICHTYSKVGDKPVHKERCFLRRAGIQ